MRSKITSWNLTSGIKMRGRLVFLIIVMYICEKFEVMAQRVRYPIGEQSFEQLRKRDCLYVDKTRFIDQIIGNGGKYYFLGRPRRFGKSLFLDTLKCFFEGKRHLFEGLYADSMEWDWEPYPVLKLDLNNEKYKTPDALDAVMEGLLKEWEREYGITPDVESHSMRFRSIIRAAHEKTGRGVVILVDEYDKPLVNNLHDHENFEYCRDKLASLYSNFKSSAEHIRLVFLTGVSRFAHLSVFSDLNNIQDISLDDDYADVCGITEEELRANFGEGIRNLASRYKYTEEQTIDRLRTFYDGYRFTDEEIYLYNPFSLLNAMQKRTFGKYWIASGTPSLLMSQMRRFDIDLKSLLDAKCGRDSLSGLDLENPWPLALFFQTGYLTIKDYDFEEELYTLGLPNEEVKTGFLEYLLPFYLNTKGEDTRFLVSEFVREFREGDVEGFMRRLKSLFASISYRMRMEQENNVHNGLLMLMLLVGLKVQTELCTSDGRIDLFVATDRYYYIIELKLDGTAREALDQINARDYALPFAVDDRRLFKIGVEFSTEKRALVDWIAE